MIDIVNQIKAIHRAVANSDETAGVLLSRRYDAEIADVWEALTDPERIRRWFMPVHGDLRPGGGFQLEGNAGGTILACERPRLLRVTFGMETSIVELRLAEDGAEATTLELEHTVPAEFGGGAGALYVGPGWDGAFLGLDRYLAGEVPDDPVAAANSLEAQRFCADSAREWAEVLRGAGAASAEEIDAGVAAALAQFAPDLAET